MRRRLSIAIALALAGAAGAASAQQAAEPFAESVLQVTINGEHLPSALLVRRDADGTLLVKASDLKALRLKTPATGAMLVNGQRYYRIGREIGANVTFDDATQSVDVNLPAQAFVATKTRYASADAPSKVQAPARRLRELRRLGGTQQRPHERRWLRRVRPVRREGRAHGNGRGAQRTRRTRAPRGSTRRGRATSPTAW